MQGSADGSECGQGVVEYALILGVIAVVAAAIVLSGGLNGIFGSTSNSLNGLNPPAATGPMTPPDQRPTSVQQCLSGGWRNYPQFTDQASCVKYVTGGG